MQNPSSLEKQRASHSSDAGLSSPSYERLEAQFQATIEMLPVGLANADLQSRITRVNGEFCELLGRTSEQLIGQSFHDISHADDATMNVGHLSRLRRGEVRQCSLEKRYIKKDGSTVWAHVMVAPSRDANGEIDGVIVILKDITSRKAAEAELERIHKELLAASRQAGMAEVATNVLHNIGNVLNSVNVSAEVVSGRIKSLRGEALTRVVELLNENAHDLGTFMCTERGKRIPEFLNHAAQHLISNQRAALEEMKSLAAHLDHIKDIVATQQTYAKRCGVNETTELSTLVEDSISMNRGAFARHGVTLIRQFEPVAPITVDKHKVLQILVNLLRNAKYACDASGCAEKTVHVRISNVGTYAQIEVKDNGVGIRPEHRAKLFTHGFTTKEHGHGYGLHSGALAARELGGTLEAFSEGVGLGARFALTLPFKPADENNG